MILDDLILITDYMLGKNLTFKQVVAKGMAKRLALYYVIDGKSLVIYEPLSEEFKAFGTENNMVADEGCIEIEYNPSDVIPITESILREIWAYQNVKAESLMLDSAPDGFALKTMLDGAARLIDEVSIYVDPSSQVSSEEKTARVNNDQPSNTALKVVGLLMAYLAKSPKYALSGKPNKSQIKELLIELAEELEVSDYGLSKVDERLLTDAMKYLENQKS